MERPPYASAQDFRRQYMLWSGAPGTVGALLILAYFGAVLDLGGDGWSVLLWSIAATTVLMSIALQWAQRKFDRDIVHAIERSASGRPTREEAIRAYVALRLLTPRALKLQIASYAFAAAVTTVWMKVAIPDTQPFTLLVIAIGSVSGGAACIPFCAWGIQRFVAPMRDWVAQQLTPAERAEHAPPASLAAKLALPVAATSAATVSFLALLGYSVALDMLEANDLRLKKAFLEGAATAVRVNPAAVRHAADLARARGVASALALVPLDRDAPAPPELALSPRELDWLRSADAAAATSRGIDSASSFAWTPIGDGHVLVAASKLETLQGDIWGVLSVVGIVLACVIAVSLAVALLVAADTRRVAAQLREAALRVGAGDFRSGGAIESEDELGAVAHAFARMTEALGATLQRVAASAARVDDAAGDLVRIGETVRQVTAAQVKGLEQANAAVSVVNRQASAITSSTQELVGGVEEASSSVLELGAASEQLNQTTIALTAQVEAVGSSIDQMVQSVAQANEAGDALNSAVADTSSSVAEMSRTLQSVDAHAWETARLSTRVVELAESGRDRVQETMRGMEVIRDATDAANRTIDGLAARMKEIGAIVDVIDEIADETNLLALNAAIIAAQAGDQGRAFSVVADEIKDLADRVLANTKEIGGVIRSVQAESQSAAEAIRQGAERVQGGVDLSAQAGVALEEITAAARHSGERIQEIVHGMREQTRAASHVEQLTLAVSEKVEQIRASCREQARGNEVVMRGSLVMRDVAQQTQRTTEEQARGALRIRDSIEGVREAVDRIHAALQQQNASCQAAATSLDSVVERTRTNDESTDALAGAATSLQQLAEALREDLRKFRIADSGDGQRRETP
jgi:methyl-accepting chemotaxis protein